METTSLENFQVEGPAQTSDISYEFVEMDPDLKYIEKPVKIEEFKDNMNRRNFELEFSLIRRLTENQKQAERLKEYNPETIKLNRYSIKHTIVELPSKDSDSKSEVESYINANYISTSRKNDIKSFIATQGPLEISIGHFWRMVWSYNISVIIMLCNFTENGKAQCENYWLDKTGHTPLEINDLQVKLVEEANHGKDVMARKFTIESIDLSKPSESRTVIHYQWLGWPDHGIPKEDSFDSMENLLSILYEEKKKNVSAPIIVHCSAGVGRTGTLLSMFNLDLILKENLKKKGDEKQVQISVFGVVRRLREQRWGMVNTSVNFNSISFFFYNSFSALANLLVCYSIAPIFNYYYNFFNKKEQYGLIYKFIANKIEKYLSKLDA